MANTQPFFGSMTHAEITKIFVSQHSGPQMDPVTIDRKWRKLGKLAANGGLTGVKY